MMLKRLIYVCEPYKLIVVNLVALVHFNWIKVTLVLLADQQCKMLEMMHCVYLDHEFYYCSAFSTTVYVYRVPREFEFENE